jgi:hypothetical protein
MFKNPIAPRAKEKKIKSPWNFSSPSYDEAKSLSVGENYGTGYKQPVGTETVSMAKCPIPYGRKK